jgi:hypothetical protein
MKLKWEAQKATEPVCMLNVVQDISNYISDSIGDSQVIFI